MIRTRKKKTSIDIISPSVWKIINTHNKYYRRSFLWKSPFLYQVGRGEDVLRLIMSVYKRVLNLHKDSVYWNTEYTNTIHRKPHTPSTIEMFIKC